MNLRVALVAYRQKVPIFVLVWQRMRNERRQKRWQMAQETVGHVAPP